MKAKLIKHDFGYNLVDANDKWIATSKNDYSHAMNLDYWLSLKNCQAIERGYDLDELAEEFAKTKSSHSTFQNTHKRDFREGFQKALELMGDKKYSEKDVKLAIQFGSEDYEPQLDGRTERFIQSLQQTEWDVEIEMGYIGECNGNNGDGCFQDSSGHNCGCFERKPKLDSNGCLILKRI